MTVDGGVATAAAGTTVRLLELNMIGNDVTAGRQFAYEVEKVHNSGISPESGLVELVVMPDGALLALERSFVVAGFVPSFSNRIYELDLSGADDVSQIPFDAGLIGQTFIPIDKGDPMHPVWMEAVGGGFGQNLEGLSVGPRLPNGDWILLGVVDDGDPVSNNTIVSLLATPSTSLPFDPDTADFDQDSDIDGADFLAWQRGFAVATLAGLSDGDANHDGLVTGADLAIWGDQFGQGRGAVAPDFDADNDVDGNDFLVWQRKFGTGTDSDDLAVWQAQFGAAAQLAALRAVPEPGALALLLLAGASGLAFDRRS